MDLVSEFHPPRRTGLLLNVAVATIMLAGGGICFWQALQGEVGTRFILLLMAAVVLLAPVPLVIYRVYALAQGFYRMDRDGIRLRWGLRAEDIPLPDVEWVRPAADMGFRLPLPVGAVPGAIIGVRNIEGLGPVEFMAADTRHLLLIATPRRIYAISPHDLKGFERSFYRIIELGSLTPITAFSTQPVAFAQRVWRDRIARGLMVGGLILAGLLFIVSALVISARSSISLGFDANLKPFQPGPPERLLLLPVMGAILYVVDVLLGMFFYRKEQQRPVAYLMWAVCILAPAMLLLGIFFL